MNLGDEFAVVTQQWKRRVERGRWLALSSGEPIKGKPRLVLSSTGALHQEPLGRNDKETILAHPL